jgi:hypothetical protein
MPPTRANGDGRRNRAAKRAKNPPASKPARKTSAAKLAKSPPVPKLAKKRKDLETFQGAEPDYDLRLKFEDLAPNVLESLGEVVGQNDPGAALAQCTIITANTDNQVCAKV